MFTLLTAACLVTYSNGLAIINKDKTSNSVISWYQLDTQLVLGTRLLLEIRLVLEVRHLCNIFHGSLTYLRLSPLNCVLRNLKLNTSYKMFGSLIITAGSPVFHFKLNMLPGLRFRTGLNMTIQKLLALDIVVSWLVSVQQTLDVVHCRELQIGYIRISVIT